MALQEVTAKHKEKFYLLTKEKVGVKLGNGAEGTVYKLKDGLVVKFTHSEQEYKFAKFLKKMKNPPPCFPKVVRVFKMRNTPHYVVVREDIGDATPELMNDQAARAAIDESTKKIGWKFTDLHGANWGARGEQLIIRDMGFSYRR